MSSIDSHPASATKTEPEIRAKSTEELRDEQMVLTGETSPGVARIEAINAHLTRFDRYFLGFGVFLAELVRDQARKPSSLGYFSQHYQEDRSEYRYRSQHRAP